MGEEVNPEPTWPELVEQGLRKLDEIHSRRTAELFIGYGEPKPCVDISCPPIVVRPELAKDWARNQFTFYAEDFNAPETPKMRMERMKREAERRRLRARFRRLRRAVKGRLRDTWSVLRHGLPDSYDY